MSETLITPEAEVSVKTHSAGDNVTSSDFEKMVTAELGGKLKLSQVHDCITATKKVLEDIVAQGAKLTLPGFMIVSTSYKPERSGINAFTNEPFTSPEKAAVVIRPGNKLKDAALRMTAENLQKLKSLKK